AWVVGLTKGLNLATRVPDNHISRKQLRFYLADDKNAFVERAIEPLFQDEYPFELRLCLPGPLCDVREEKQVGVAVDGPPEPPFESLPERVLTEDEGSVDEGEEESDRGVSEESDYYGSSAADSPEDDEGREAQETEGEKLSRKAARPAGKAARGLRSRGQCRCSAGEEGAKAARPAIREAEDGIRRIPRLQADYPHENERQISKLLKGRWSRMDDNAK
ncbi:MAG: hypothetical protein BJ554DRAFT_6191, partial [Olpidium bornovanus]